MSQRQGQHDPWDDEELEEFLSLDQVMRKYEVLPPPPEFVPGVSFNGEPLSVDMCDDIVTDTMWMD